MPWIKLDDHWISHPKVVKAGRDARDLWLASITWCAQYLTDGAFPDELLPTLGVMASINVANTLALASALVDVRLWEKTDTGYQVHDYLDYNPSKDEVEALKQARTEAGRAGGQAKASKTASKTLAKVYPVPVPVPQLKDTHTSAENGFDTPANYQLVLKLTGWMDVPKSEENRQYMLDLRTIRAHHPDDIESYLSPFWTTYKKRYQGSTRLAWIGWALTGTIPPEKKNGNGRKPEPDNQYRPA